MRTTGAFTLHVEPATEAMPARVSIVVSGAPPDATGLLHLTPDCMTLDQLESCINALQDELDVLRAEARGPSTARRPRLRPVGEDEDPERGRAHDGDTQQGHESECQHGTSPFRSRDPARTGQGTLKPTRQVREMGSELLPRLTSARRGCRVNQGTDALRHRKSL